MASEMESDSVEEGYYTLENVYSRKNLNVKGDKVRVNANAMLYDKTGRSNTLCEIEINT